MNLFARMMKGELALEAAKVEIMLQLSTDQGFFNQYECVKSSRGNSSSAFHYVNSVYRMLFGQYRYESFENFQSKCLNAGYDDILNDSHFLRVWFITKGFDQWVSFRALVLHFYPGTNEHKLLQFWSGQYAYPDTVNTVNCVKQIIG